MSDALFGFDWPGFLAVALPVLFTTVTSIVSYLAGQKSSPNRSAIDGAVMAVTIAAEAAQAAVKIAEAAQKSAGQGTGQSTKPADPAAE